jgi:hypothetical protein
MEPGRTSITTTSAAIRARMRFGVATLALVLLWLVYMLGLLPFGMSLIEGIESDALRIGTVIGVIGAAVFALMNLRAVGRLLHRPARRVVNYFTPVLALDVAAERLKQIRKRIATVEKRVGDVAALRVGQENEVARLEREEQAVLREAQNPRSMLDDATLGRRLNHAQEALRLRRDQLDEVRATEDMLVDAREVCDLCDHRVQIAIERYRYAVEIARTFQDVGSIAGAEGPSDTTDKAEGQCLSELDEVDLLLANLDSALYDRKLGDRAAALRIAEMRQQLRGAPPAPPARVELPAAPARVEPPAAPADDLEEDLLAPEEPARRARRR